MRFLSTIETLVDLELSRPSKARVANDETLAKRRARINLAIAYLTMVLEDEGWSLQERLVAKKRERVSRQNEYNEGAEEGPACYSIPQPTLQLWYDELKQIVKVGDYDSAVDRVLDDLRIWAEERDE